MKQKNTNVGSYIAVLALGYSIIYAGYYLYCYVKSVLFHEPLNLNQFITGIFGYLLFSFFCIF